MMDWLEYEGRTWRTGPSALEKLAFCIRQLRKADGFNEGLDWGTNIVPHLTLEELIGAVLHGEDELRNLEESYHTLEDDYADMEWLAFSGKAGSQGSEAG